jgi:TolB protein
MLKQIFIEIIAVAILTCVSGCQTKSKSGEIALSRLTGNYWQIWTMCPNGDHLRQITNSPSDKRYPAWSGDGKSILYRTNNDKAYTFDIVSMKERQLLKHFGRVGNIAESPLDLSYVFAKIGIDRDTGDLWIVDHNENNQKILTRNIGLQYPPAWSPDGKSVAYTAGGGRQPRELSIIDINSMCNQQITSNNALELVPAYSPDGAYIAYSSNVTGNFEIWLLDVASGQSTQLTFDKVLDTRPCWSPDGQKIMFTSRRSGSMQLWIMDKDGSSPKQLTSGAECVDPAWKRE